MKFVGVATGVGLRLLGVPLDGRVILSPNAEVFASRIINNTADPLRRGKVEAWIGYDADLKAAVQTACDGASQAEGVLHTPALPVRVSVLGQDGIAHEVPFWTDSRRADYKNTASELREGR